MTDLLVKLFIKNSENVKDAEVREKYGLLGSVVGIVVNIILSAAKYAIGVISKSVSITADAINNLADAASCIVTLVSFKMAARKPDKEHPFGHGRIEYIAALAVGFLVELMGYELIKSSVEKIRNPEPVEFSVPAVAVLAVSILGKVWLYLFNKKLGNRIQSPAMLAVAKDSLSDTTATLVAAVALVCSLFTQLPVDGFMGLIVSGFILMSGFGILKEAISILLGNPPEKETVDELVEYVLSFDEIIGIHDLVIHSYGASSTFATLHAEIPSDENMLKAHDTIDNIEQEVKKRLGIELVIHMDPIEINNEKVSALKERMREIVSGIDKELTIHDFRVVDGPTHTNLVFDVVVPHGFEMREDRLIGIINDKINESDNRYRCVITVDKCYI
ncbi:MAG: cation diffusion facilitator family transporter [Ruminococcaceae bacterium]|nr:cation diffusion facilitator family transporter [Oscillospiraceae bacterium]